MKTRHNTSDGTAKQAAPKQGETLPVMSDGRAPRLPHERDESSSSQSSEPRENIQQAAKDIEAGIKDGDLGPPMDDTYHREFRKGDNQAGSADAQVPEHGGPRTGPRVHKP